MLLSVLAAMAMSVGTHAQPQPSAATGADKPAASHAVLLLNSYHKGLSWTDAITGAVERDLSHVDGVELTIEYMDAKRSCLRDTEASLMEHFRAKHSHRRYSVVMVSDNDALAFVRRHREELFPATPIVFCGINDYTPALIDDSGWLAGVREVTDAGATFDLMRQLHPGMRRCVVVGDATPTGTAELAAARLALGTRRGDVEVVYWENLTKADLLARLDGLSPDRDVVLLTVFNRDADGTFFSDEASGQFITQAARCPVYGLWDFYLGTGVVGGRMASALDQGIAAAALTRRLLTGESPSRIGVIDDSPNRTMLDASSLTRLGVRLCDVPSGTNVMDNGAVVYRAAGQPVLRLGVLANQGKAACEKAWGPTVDYLSIQVPGYRFQLVPLDFAEVHSAVQGRRIDFLITNSSQYAELDARYGLAPVATMGRLFADTPMTMFGGVIFCRADRGDIQTLADLHHKRFGAVNADSLGGWRAALLELRRHGVDPQQHMAALSMLNTHDAVVRAVMDGSVDAGTVRTDVIESLRARGLVDPGTLRVLNARAPDGKFALLCSTALYPEWPLARLPGTPEAVSNAVGGALMALSSQSPAAQAAGIAGWTLPHSYQVVHDLLRGLRLPPYDAMPRHTLGDLVREYWVWLLMGAAALGASWIITANFLRLNRRMSHMASALAVSREQLHATLLSIGDAVITTDTHGRVIQLNPVAESLTGWSTEEARGHAVTTVMPMFDQATQQPVDNPIWAVMRDRRTVELQAGTLLRSRAGHERRIADSCAPICSADGSLIGAVLVFRDVTAQHEQERALRESEARFRTLFEESHDPYLLLDGSRIIDCNTASLRLLGATRDDVIGRHPDMFSPPTQPDGRSSEVAARAHVEAAVSQGSQKFEWVHRRVDGSEFWADVVLTPLVIAGRVLLFTSWRDITARKTAERDLEQARSLLDAAIMQSPAGIAIADAPDVRIRLINAAAMAIRGDTDAALDGIDMSRHATNWQTYHPDGTPYESQDLPLTRAVLQGETTRDDEIVIRRASGEERHVLVNASPIIGSDGAIQAGIAVFHDITDRKLADAAVRESQARLAAIIEATNVGVWEWNVRTGVTVFDERWAEMLGYSLADLSPVSIDTWRSMVHPDDLAASDRLLARVFDREMDHYDIECRMRHRDGSWVWVHDRGMVLEWSPDGKPLRMAGTHADITRRKNDEEALRKLSRAVEQTPTSIVICDQKGRIEYVNPAFTRVTGYTSEEVLGKNPRILKSGHMPREWYTEMWNALTSGREWRGEFQNRRKNGELYWEMAVISPLRDPRGQTTHYLAVKEETTKRKAMEDELRAVARTDKLTGLPNRAMLCERLQQALVHASLSRQHYFAVLFLDFDRFKAVNDALGHNMGDQLLQAIAVRLRASVGPGGEKELPSGTHMAARLGGDEFVVLLDDLASPDDALIVAQRLLEVLAQPYHLGEHQVFSTASIGVVTSSMVDGSADDVLRDADTAMYEAKLAGKGQYVVFDASMRQRVQHRLNLENELRLALNTDQLFLMYQPIVCLSTGRIEGYEALVRWRHPERGHITPGEFIPIAEDTGLIVPLGEWVLREACRQFARWRKTMGDAAPPSLSVNLSRRQLLLPNLAHIVQGILEETGMPPDRLHLEVTESAAMKDVQTTVRLLHALKAVGVKLDLDDFGTGYSSLACLHEFPLDVLKIDRSFVSNITRGRDFAALVHAVAQLARNLNIRVVAEGIETPEQTSLLQSLDCDLGQGYLFGKPMLAESVPVFRVPREDWPGRAA